MIGQVPDHLAAPVFFFGCFCHVLEVGGMEEEVPVELIAARVAFPIPLAIGALGPTGLVNLPKSIALGFFTIALDSARIGIGPLHRSDRAGHIAFRRRRGSTLGHLLKKSQRLESACGPGLGLRVTGRRIGEALAGSVHRGPQSVIIGIFGRGCRPIRRNLQRGFGGESIRGPADVLIDLALVALRLLGQGYGLLIDVAHTIGRGEPGHATGLNQGLGHRIRRQPTRSLTVLELGAIPADHSAGRGEPNLTRRTRSDPGELVPWQSVFALEEPPTFRRTAPHPGLACEPELPRGIDGDAQNRAHRPSPITRVDDGFGLPARGGPTDQSMTGGGPPLPIAIHCHLGESPRLRPRFPSPLPGFPAIQSVGGDHQEPLPHWQQLDHRRSCDIGGDPLPLGIRKRE